MKKSPLYSSALGFIVCASVLAGCSSPRKHSEPSTATARADVSSVAPAIITDTPASDTGVKTHSVKAKSPANLGAASSGQGL